MPENETKNEGWPVMITWRQRLIEWAVSVVIIGLLIVLLLPAVSNPVGAARRMQCVHNLKQIGIALHNYHDTYDCLPPAHTVDENGRRLHSWRVLVLPFLEDGQEIYDRIKLDEPWNSEHNKTLFESMPPHFACPETRTGRKREDIRRPQWTRYQVIVGPDTLFPGAECRPLPDPGHRAETLLVVESTVYVQWMSPLDLPAEALEMGVPEEGRQFPAQAVGSAHAAGANVLLADGVVKFRSCQTTPDELRQASRVKESAITDRSSP